MKKVLFTSLLILLLSAASPFQAQATFPGKNIVFWDLEQSDEQNNTDLAEVYDLAKKNNYQPPLNLNQKKNQTSQK